MKKISQKIAAGLLAVSVASTGLAVNIQTAEALNLGGALGNIAGGILGGGGAVDANSLGKSQTLLLANLSVSSALMNAAFQNCQLAVGESVANKSIIQTETITKGLNKSDMAEATKLKNAAEKAEKDKTADTMKSNLKAALESGDEAKLKQIDGFIKTANQQRMISDSLGAIAVVQAGKIIADTLKGGANISNLSKFVDTAKQAKSLLDTRSKFSKMLSTATAEYKKTRGIKDPSKNDIKAASDGLKANE